MTDEETRRGAYNRAKSVADAFAAANAGRRPLYAVGLVRAWLSTEGDGTPG